MSIHQRAALWWVLSAPFVWAPALASARKPEAGHLIAELVVIVTICIAVCPLLLCVRRFRQWFCWTDAWSSAQRAAINRRDLRAYYKATANSGYVGRLKPYVYRLTATSAVLLVLSCLLRGQIAFLMLAAGFYPLGVTILCLASLPLSSFVPMRRRS